MYNGDQEYRRRTVEHAHETARIIYEQHNKWSLRVMCVISHTPRAPGVFARGVCFRPGVFAHLGLRQMSRKGHALV